MKSKPRWLLPVYFLLLAHASGGAWAAEPAVDENVVHTAPVIVDGQVLFHVRGVQAFPAEERAAGIAGRLRELARDSTFDAALLAIEERGAETRIVARGTPVVRLQDADAAVEGVERGVVAEVYLAKMRHAISEYRAARNPEALFAALWQIALATLIAAAVVLAVRRGRKALDRRLARGVDGGVKGVSIRPYELLRKEHIWSFLRGGVRLLAGLALLALATLYLQFVMARLPWTRGAAAQLGGWMLAPLQSIGRSLIEKAPDLVFLVVLFVITLYSLRLLRAVFTAIGRGELAFEGFDPEWAEPTYNLVRLAVIAFAVMVAYPYIPGSGSDAFKGVSLFLGVVVSLGSSSAISNVIAGYVMIYRRLFRPGDVVKIGEAFGTVTEVRLQVTRLRTLKNEEIVVPNSTILNSEVVNYTTLAKSNGLALHTTVGIGYETPWRQVEAMLLEAARRTAGALAEPKPFVNQLALADFAVTYEINVYIDDPQIMRRTYSELHRNILDVFNEYGVQIMTPAYEGDPETPKVVPRADFHLPPAAAPPAGGDGR
jgi:small-conductance mechanosensitive channel